MKFDKNGFLVPQKISFDVKHDEETIESNKIRNHPCEGCLGLIDKTRRRRCPECKILFCKHHLKHHKCLIGD